MSMRLVAWWDIPEKRHTRPGRIARAACGFAAVDADKTDNWVTAEVDICVLGAWELRSLELREPL